MNKNDMLRELGAFPYDRNDYWIITGGAMVMYGFREQTHDIDLGCTKEMDDLMEKDGHLVKRTDDGKRKFCYGQNIEIFEDWLYDTTQKKDGFNVISIEGLKQMKRQLGREKDLRDLQLIEDYLNMDRKDYSIRLENKEDYSAVENLVRESFWNVYRPGCLEHYVIHVLRDDPAFIRELDFVMEKDGELIGQNMFMRTVINADDGRTIPVLTMGPICITPPLKRKGYGKALLDYSLEKAAELGYGAVLFEGNIGFYGKCGFDYASRFKIRYHDLPEGADSSFFLCRELIPGYLDKVTGVYQTPQGYYVDEEEAEEFDKQFPKKEKQRLPGQIF